MSFVTPIGYKANLLIMGAGGYKFNDFVKIGLPLAIIMWVAFSFILPALFIINKKLSSYQHYYSVVS